jgi:sec-independent protein translocase protein TatA
MEIGVILLLVVVFFGAKKLPQLGTGLGQGIRNFKESVTGKDEQIEEAKKETNS